MSVKKFLLAKLRDGLAQSTVKHMKTCIAGTLNLALDEEVIASNPAHKMGKIFKVRDMEEETVPLDQEELEALLRHFQQEDPGNYPFVLTLCLTGMRLGDAMALQRDDSDFQRRLITIRRAHSRDIIGKPKSGKSRKVDMSRNLCEALRDLQHQRKKLTLKKGWKQMPEWVFINKAGNMLNKTNWRDRVFYPALKEAGIRKIRPHDLRYTDASLLISAGESLAYVRDQLGHHSIKVTVDIYGHLTPDGNKEAVDRLDEIDDIASIRTLSAP